MTYKEELISSESAEATVQAAQRRALGAPFLEEIRSRLHGALGSLR